MRFLKWEIIPSGEREKYRLKYQQQKETIRLLENDYKIKSEQLFAQSAKLSQLQDTCKELRSYCEKYKKLYLDEQQKRLELAELVRKLEGEADGD